MINIRPGRSTSGERIHWKRRLGGRQGQYGHTGIRRRNRADRSPFAIPTKTSRVSWLTDMKHKSLWQHSEKYKLVNLVFFDSFLSLCVCQYGVALLHCALQRCKSTRSPCVYLLLATHRVRSCHVT
jgi:hypothetical protein